MNAVYYILINENYIVVNIFKLGLVIIFLFYIYYNF